MQYVSMANTFNELVDCRMVQFEMDYFFVSKVQLTELAQACVLLCDQLFSEEFYYQWNWAGRKIKAQSLQERILSASSSFDYSCTADVLCSVVHDNKSFHVYDKLLLSSNSSQAWYDTTVSYDYVDALQEYIRDLNDCDKCKDAVMKLFYEPKRIKRALWRDHDASAFFVSHRYSNNNLFRGSFIFRIALQCLNHSNNLVEQIIDYSIKATSITRNINARIALSPITSPASPSAHMMYFGGGVRGDKSHIEAGCRPEEWYPYYYFQGAEWFNLLSPSVASRLPSLLSDSRKVNNVISKEMTTGVILINSTKSIEQTDVSDLYVLRKLLYPVLYPGSSRLLFQNINNPKAFGFLAKPRQQWEYLPLFPEEISVDQNAILFKYAL